MELTKEQWDLLHSTLSKAIDTTLSRTELTALRALQAHIVRVGTTIPDDRRRVWRSDGPGQFGGFLGAKPWQGAAATPRQIEAGDHDTHDEDIAKGINDCLKKDGSNAGSGLFELRFVEGFGSPIPDGWVKALGCSTGWLVRREKDGAATGDF